MSKNDGGPAFPISLPNVNEPGMSLRDWFAATASDADVDVQLCATVGEAQVFEGLHGFKQTRVWARYQHADAMLAERKKESNDAK